MAGSAKRERQLARQRYERQQQRRAQRRARQRRGQQVAAVVVAVVLVVGGAVVLANKLGDGTATAAGTKPTKPAATSPATTPSATATAANGDCTYTKTASAPSKPVSIATYDKAKAADYRKPFSVTLKTNLGDIVIALAADKAPCTVNSFKHLATSKFFDSTSCHRLTTDSIFVLQCGDPTGGGSGGPGYGFGVENAPADGAYPAGTVAMARTSDPGSNGSQFFLVYKDTVLQDATGYTVFGTITKGLDIVQQVADAGVDGGGGDGKPKQAVTIKSVTVGKA